MSSIKYKLKVDNRNKNSPYREINRDEFVALKTFDAVELICSYNQLTSLPELPLCKILSCSYNQLTSLPELTHCEILYCSDNSLPYYYPKTAEDFPKYYKLINAIKLLQALFLLRQVFKGCPWHPIGKKHIYEAWERYEKSRSK